MSETTKSAGPRSRVLVVDDDAALAEMLSIVLRNEGFEPIWCAHGDKAFSAFHEAKPDLVLLDLMLPGRDGVDVCRDIRAESGVPIVMLTAKTDTIDVVVGLEAGADDYVAKPFKAKELVARIKTRLRRVPASEEVDVETLRIGDLSISVDGHSVKRDGVQIQLTPLGVRPAARPGPTALAGLQSRGAARAGVGLPARGRHPAGQRARPAAAFEDRAGPRASGDRGDRARHRLQGRRNRAGPVAACAGTRSQADLAFGIRHMVFDSEDPEIALVAIPRQLVVAVVAAASRAHGVRRLGSGAGARRFPTDAAGHDRGDRR